MPTSSVSRYIAERIEAEHPTGARRGVAGGLSPNCVEATPDALQSVATVSITTQTPPLLIPIAEAARRLSASERHTWKLVARGDLASRACRRTHPARSCLRP